MINSLKTRELPSFEFDNGPQQVLCKVLRGALSFVLLPPCLTASPVSNLSQQESKPMPRFVCGDVSESVTNSRNPQSQPQTDIHSAAVRAEAKALPLEWLLAPKSLSLTDRVLARLVQLEAHEPDSSFRDDYRIAWHIVLISHNGEATYCTPAVLAWYKVLGCHPDHVWTRIQQRRQAMLGLPISFPKSSAANSSEKGRLYTGERNRPAADSKKSALPSPTNKKEAIA